LLLRKEKEYFINLAIMSDPYSLVMSLLTGGPASALALPVQPWNLPQNLLNQLDTDEAKIFDELAPQKIVPTFEKPSPEFITQQLSLQINELPSIDLEPTARTSDFGAERRLASGSQLYLQRLAALRVGQVYTHLPFDSFQSDWAKPSSQPTYEQWKDLLAQEAKAVAVGQGSSRLSILVGDSLSQWFPSEQLPKGQFWLNQGISGDTSSGILQRLSVFSQTRPQAVYVMAGINDLRRGATDETILNNIHQIIGNLQQSHPHAQIVVESILPTRLPAIGNSRIRYLNRQIAALTRQEGVEYLNLHPLFTDFDGNLRQNLTTDGLHLSQRGYQIWQWALQQTDARIALNEIAKEHKNS
jgi:lysophospholipase L1-like esterase